MKTRLLIIISIIVASIIIGTLWFVDYYETKHADESVKNNEWVVNCIAGESDKIIPSMSIENSTHQFDLGNCIWIKK